RQEAHLRAEVRRRTEALEREKGRAEAALADARAARATVEAQAAQLRALDEAKSRLFANLSHEFRTPLTLILGPLEQALAADPDRPGLRTAHDQAGRLLDLINQLLDLSKLDAGHLRLRRTRTDLGALVERTAGAFRTLAEGRGIGLTVQTPEEPVQAVVDAAHVERVLTNLLANALAHTDAGGKVAVTLGRGDAGGDGTPVAVLAVRDTGAGIPAAALPYLFDRFYQVEREQRAGAVGTGIGLALAKELVELHGGTVAVESEEGFGSTFTVTLPLGEAGFGSAAERDGEAPGRPHVPAPPASEAMPEQDGPSAAVPDGPRPTLLLVEDHDALRGFLAHALADGFDVIEAADGEEALRLARERRPDLVVSDVMMPRRDGFALTAALRADEALRETPILLLTARADADGEIAGLAAGADDYLAKPFSVPVLRAHLDALLSRRRALRERYGQHVTVGPKEVVVTSEEAAFVERVRDVVEAALGDPHLTVEALADRLAVSPRQLSRRMRALTGLSPAAFVRSMRLQRAAQLLAGRSGGVAEVAYAVGFRSVSHFAKRFKAEFGVPPSEYAAAEGG
ncbi:MAG: response regulator, partial [Rhodothermales bacterium]|nr:response regulator [Rhodothermales bacterium]